MNVKKNKNKLIIAGPCSVESKEQVITTAIKVDENINIDFLRGGIWKPRSRPNSFEGIGERGLKWLKEAGEIIDKPVITEVANTSHVEAALKVGIDALWIGARTSVNPFLTEELSESLRGVNIPIAVKNPINPDINLWIGAFERIQQKTNGEIILIHRGFSYFGESEYRNNPNWEIPIEMMRIYPEIPMICDPSHICGNKQLISAVSQKALDLNMNGLMIETHVDPINAKSDSKQQVNPIELKKIITSLVFKKEFSVDEEFTNSLQLLRSKIDTLDHEIINLFSQRFKIVEKIGNYKKENKVTVYQQERWNEIIESRKNTAEFLKINIKFIQEYIDLIHNESIRIQTQIVNNKKHG